MQRFARAPHANESSPCWQAPFSSQHPAQFDDRQRGVVGPHDGATASAMPSAKPRTAEEKVRIVGSEPATVPLARRHVEYHAQARAVQMPIAFFDFDVTLISENSARLWLRRELALGQVTRSQAARAAYWLARYHVGFANLEQAVGEAVGTLKGSPSAQLRARTQSFYERQVKQLYRPGGRAVVEHHRRLGDRLVLLTSSSNYLADMVGEALKLDAVLCNRLEVDAQGLHTGRTVGGICFGAGKLRFAHAEADAHHQPLSQATFYTDSYSDLPVLEAVGRPVAVNPDRRLARHATRHHWDVVDWGEP